MAERPNGSQLTPFGASPADESTQQEIVRRVDAFFLGKRSDSERIRQLREFLDGYERRINPDILPLMLSAYNDLINSNWIAWLYPGGRANQPKWVTDYVDILHAVGELLKLEAKRPDPARLPTREQALGRKQG